LVSTDLFLVGNKLEASKLTRSIRHKCLGVLRSHLLVEVEIELSLLLPSFSVHLVSKVGQELLDVVNGAALWNVGQFKGGLENHIPVVVVVGRDYTFLDELNNLGDHDVRDLAPLFPKDVSHRLGILSSIGTHFKLKVLKHQLCKEHLFARAQT